MQMSAYYSVYCRDATCIFTAQVRLEMLHLWRLLSTDACEPPLRRAILVNGLINLRGQEDSWLEIDRHNEHLNLELKELLHARRNGTFDVKTLFDYCLPSCKYITETVRALLVKVQSALILPRMPQRRSDSL